MKTLFKIFNYMKNYVSKFWFIEIFKIFSDQKKLHSKILNVLGVQPFRAWIAHKIKERNQRLVIVDIPKNMRAQMDESGYVRIERIKENQKFFDLTKTNTHLTNIQIEITLMIKMQLYLDKLDSRIENIQELRVFTFRVNGVILQYEYL